LRLSTSGEDAVKLGKTVSENKLRVFTQLLSVKINGILFSPASTDFLASDLDYDHSTRSVCIHTHFFSCFFGGLL
jgi:hypothetical protein